MGRIWALIHGGEIMFYQFLLNHTLEISQRATSSSLSTLVYKALTCERLVVIMIIFSIYGQGNWAFKAVTGKLTAWKALSGRARSRTRYPVTKSIDLSRSKSLEQWSEFAVLQWHLKYQVQVTTWPHISYLTLGNYIISLNLSFLICEMRITVSASLGKILMKCLFPFTLIFTSLQPPFPQFR